MAQINRTAVSRAVGGRLRGRRRGLQAVREPALDQAYDYTELLTLLTTQDEEAVVTEEKADELSDEPEPVESGEPPDSAMGRPTH